MLVQRGTRTGAPTALQAKAVRPLRLGQRQRAALPTRGPFRHGLRHLRLPHPQAPCRPSTRRHALGLIKVKAPVAHVWHLRWGWVADRAPLAPLLMRDD